MTEYMLEVEAYKKETLAGGLVEMEVLDMNLDELTRDRDVWKAQVARLNSYLKKASDRSEFWQGKFMTMKWNLNKVMRKFNDQKKGIQVLVKANAETALIAEKLQDSVDGWRNRALEAERKVRELEAIIKGEVEVAGV